jgi:curved DNA-binding protein
MAVQFKDYYEVLGVARDADAATIKRTYRKLARQHHPDVSKRAGAEDRFKEITEAYDVLCDPAKRSRYDQLGAGWKNGQSFTPPPGWETAHFDFQGGGERAGAFGGGGAEFSDFFDMLFGAQRQRAARGRRPWAESIRGGDQETELGITLEEAYQGATRTMVLQSEEAGLGGGARRRNYDVRIPPGTTDGSRIRLAGQGAAGHGDGPAGDLYLLIHIEPHPRFTVNEHDLLMDLPVTPWEAALGASVTVQTLDGPAALKIPAGVSSGQKIRMRERGLPKRKGEGRGDLLAAVRVVVPKVLTSEEKRLFEELAKKSPFQAR